MPRPRKQQGAKLARQIIFRVKAKDYAALEAQAAKLSLSVNQLARKLTCSRTGKLVIKTEGRMDPAYIAQLKRIGLNLNQMVRRFHITGKTSPRMETVLEQIEHIVFETIEEEAEQ